MKYPLAAISLCVALASTARGQEQDYNEDLVRPSKVPPAVSQRAEKEAPGAKFSTIYRDNEKGYRLVGKKADGSWVSVRVDRDGALDRVRTWTEVPKAKVSRAVSAALQAEVRKPPAPRSGKDLTGFATTRVWLVDEFVARDGKTSTFYEFLGKTAQNPYYIVQVDRGGEVVGVKMALLRTSAVRRQSFPPAAVPPLMRANLEQLVPGIRPTRIVRVSVTTTYAGGSNVHYRIYGRDRAGRAVEADVMGLGEITNLFEEVPVAELPKDVAEAVRTLAEKEKDLKGFRPAEARRVRWLGRGGTVGHLVYGDDVYGFPVAIEVDDKLEARSSADEREDWEVGTVAPVAGEGVPPSGFAVLAASYGNIGWIDVTDLARAAIPAGVLKVGIGGSLPDPSFGHHKAIVILYSVNGKVGVSTTPDGAGATLPPEFDAAKLAEVPARGFAVLAARYGVADHWADVTDAVRARVSGDRIEVKVADIPLPDPAVGQNKVLAVAYADDGRAGLLVTHQAREISLPLAGPPVNSSALEAKKVEFTANVLDASFSQDGRQVVAGVEDGSIRLFDPAAGRETLRLDGHGPGRVTVAFAGSGNAALSGGADKVLRLWDLKTGKEKAIFRGHTAEVHRLVVTPNGRLAASWSWDRTLRLWDVPTARELRQCEGHTDVVDGLAFTHDGKILMSASWDGSLRSWDTATGKELRKYQRDAGPLGAVALARDGRTILVGARDRTVRRVDVATAREVGKFETYSDASLGLAWLPDGNRFLATDGTVALLWDIDSDRLVLKLDRHTGQVRAIAVSPDGRRAVTGGEDRSLRFWNLP